MSKKIAAIDLDECTVDSSRRAAQAQATGKMDWDIMFRAELILDLDEPMEVALVRLRQLEAEGYEIWYVTSRQADKCHRATVAWLAREGYPFPQNVICRPPFHKTIEFKAREVARLNSELGPVVLFVDNSEKNRQAVAALAIENLEIREFL